METMYSDWMCTRGKDLSWRLVYRTSSYQLSVRDRDSKTCDMLW